MDRHDLPGNVTAEHVAAIHQDDLKIEHEYGCKGLTYWFDGARKTAFCLISAPNKKAIQEMHEHAHGAIPNSIVEVDPNVVESFLGRIEDPEKSQNIQLNIINDPAFRILMVTGFEYKYTNDIELYPKSEFLQEYINAVINLMKTFKARIVNNRSGFYLISYRSVSDAVSSALEMQQISSELLLKYKYDQFKLNIGMSSGIPVTEKEEIFEDTIKMAVALCNIVPGDIVVSSDIKDLFESENNNISFDDDVIRTISVMDQKFMSCLMDFMEISWKNANLKLDDFCINLGISKSQLYRKIKSLTGFSLNTFIKNFRLQKALDLLEKKKGNISEIAFETGFNSPAYFSKCFQKKYGVLPSYYLKKHP